MEKIAYRTADQVVSLLPNALSHMKKHGLKEEKYCYIPNGVSIADCLKNRDSLPKLHNDIINKQKKLGHFLIGYAGAHGIPNALDDLIQAMILLKQEGFNNISLILVGEGEQKQHLQRLVTNSHLDNVLFLDSVLKNQVPSFLDKMDIVYLGWKNKPIYNFGISPNKIFEYMIAAKPILQAISSPYDLISEIGCGISVEAENAQAIAAGIKVLAYFSKDKLMKMGELGAQVVKVKYSYEKLASDYIKCFKQ